MREAGKSSAGFLAALLAVIAISVQACGGEGDQEARLLADQQVKLLRQEVESIKTGHAQIQSNLEEMRRLMSQADLLLEKQNARIAAASSLNAFLEKLAAEGLGESPAAGVAREPAFSTPVLVLLALLCLGLWWLWRIRQKQLETTVNQQVDRAIAGILQKVQSPAEKMEKPTSPAPPPERKEPFPPTSEPAEEKPEAQAKSEPPAEAEKEKETKDEQPRVEPEPPLPSEGTEAEGREPQKEEPPAPLAEPVSRVLKEPEEKEEKKQEEPAPSERAGKKTAAPKKTVTAKKTAGAAKKKASAKKKTKKTAAKKKTSKKSSVRRTTAKCKVPGCNNKHRSKGYCNKHYQQWRRGKLKEPEEGE